MRHHVVDACIQALQQLVGAHMQSFAEQDAPTAERYERLARALAPHERGFVARSLEALEPVRRQRGWDGTPLPDDPGTTPWDLACRLLLEFHATRTAKGSNAQGLPHNLHRLAQQLAGVKTPSSAQLAKVCLNLFDEMSADLTADALNAYYGIPASQNLVLKALRPVDRANNDCLRVLAQWRTRPEFVSLILGRPLYPQQSIEDAQIRRAIADRRVPVTWLLRWNALYPEAHEILIGMGLAERGTPATPPLSGKDLVLSTPEKTEAKLERTLQQLADLHELGTYRAHHVPLDGLLYRLAEDAVDDDAETQLEPASPETELHDDSADTPGNCSLDAALRNLKSLQLAIAVGVKVKLLDQVKDPELKKQLTKALTEDLASAGSFTALGLPPKWSALTPTALARNAGLSAAAFRAAVDAAALQCQPTSARPSHTAA